MALAVGAALPGSGRRERDGSHTQTHRGQGHRPWGDPRLKSSALQAQILKSLKSVPGHTFKAPDTNILKSDKSLRAADVGDGCLA